jgi:hypothetical protein
MTATTEDILQAAHLMNALTRIDLLDDAWTTQLQQASGSGAVSAMEATAIEIARALNEAGDETDTLLRLLEAEGSAINQRALEAIENSPLTSDLQQTLRNFLEANEGMTGWCRTSVTRLRQDASRAAEEVLEQQSQFAAGFQPPGDLPKVLKCALIGAAAGAAAAHANGAALIALVTLANDA